MARQKLALGRVKALRAGPVLALAAAAAANRLTAQQQREMPAAVGNLVGYRVSQYRWVGQGCSR